MAVPERLVTIRTYDSPDLAEGDHQTLVQAGIHAYIAGGYYRRARGALRVPASQIDAALEILPPEVPSLEVLNRPSLQCARCGSESVGIAAPAARYILVAGIGLGAWAIYTGQFESAGVVVLATIAFVAGVRARSRRLRCEACGNEWPRGCPD